jgi:serine/threonine-protein kinase
MPGPPPSAEPTLQAEDPAERLQRLWDEGQSPDVDAFLAQAGPLPPAQVCALLRIDQRQRWRAGQRVAAESYLHRHPNLRSDPEAVLDLIYQEFLVREDLGERSTITEYQQRFPEYAEVLRAQAELHQAMEPSAERTALGPSRTRLERAAPPAPVREGDLPRLEGEIEALLRRRLRMTVLVFLLAGLLEVWRTVYPLVLGGSSGLTGARLVSCGAAYAVMALFAGLLWSRGARSLAQLRRLEVILFGAIALLLSINQYLVYSTGGLLPYAALGIDGIYSVAKSLSLTPLIVIIVYGMFIPNSGKRCAIVAGLMAGCMLLTAVLGLAGQPLEPSLVVTYCLTLGFNLLFALVLAVFGSHRIHALQQQAFDARRLGQYLLKRRLGIGGMGEVYLAEHVRLRRLCALKLIRPERAGDPRELRRFEREVQATANLTHPNTVRVFDYGHADDGTFFYAMEYLPGLNLEQLVEQTGPLPAERAIHLLRQVCGALQEAHAGGLIHRDIKPSNIIVGPYGGQSDMAKLLDFGLARVQQMRHDETRLTQEGDIAGTPAFMSPEQAAGRPDLEARSDIYSLGALAYFLLTGQPPFAGRSSVQVLAAHLYEPPAPLTNHRPDLSAELQAIVLRCLAKDPAERFSDIPGLEQALAKCPCASQWTEEDAARWWHLQEEVRRA